MYKHMYIFIDSIELEQGKIDVSGVWGCLAYCNGREGQRTVGDVSLESTVYYDCCCVGILNSSNKNKIKSKNSSSRSEAGGLLYLLFQASTFLHLAAGWSHAPWPQHPERRAQKG